MIPLREQEKIIHIARRHWWQGARALAAPVLLIALFALMAYKFNFTFFGRSGQVIGGVLFVSAGMAGAGIYRWRHDALVVTNQRLVRRDQRGVFHSLTTELLYSDVSDIAYRKQGILAALVDRGTLLIRTTGDRRLLMDRVPRPETVVEIVNSLRMALAQTPRPAPETEPHGRLA